MGMLKQLQLGVVATMYENFLAIELSRVGVSVRNCHLSNISPVFAQGVAD